MAWTAVELYIISSFALSIFSIIMSVMVLIVFRRTIRGLYDQLKGMIDQIYKDWSMVKNGDNKIERVKYMEEVKDSVNPPQAIAVQVTQDEDAQIARLMRIKEKKAKIVELQKELENDK